MMIVLIVVAVAHVPAVAIIKAGLAKINSPSHGLQTKVKNMFPYYNTLNEDQYTLPASQTHSYNMIKIEAEK